MLTVLVSFNQWAGGLSPAHQVFWFLAIIFSVLFFIQLVMLVIADDSAGNSDPEYAGDDEGFDNEFAPLSARSIFAFFTFFGWTGVLTMANQLSVLMAVLISTLVGFAAMFGMAYLMQKSTPPK